MNWRAVAIPLLSFLLSGCWYKPQTDYPRYTVVPVPGSVNAVWLVDTFTGSLSRCEGAGTNKMPVCSPLASPSGSEPFYQYDPVSKKLVPMNDAARKEYCATHRDAKGRPPLWCLFKP